MASEVGRLLTGALSNGGLFALAVLPIPPEILLPFAGFQVALGDLGFVPTWTVATAASVIAAMPLYLVARLGGRPLLLRHGRLLALDERRLDRAQRFFDRWGEGVVLFGRMVTGVRSVVSVPAGLAGMPARRFALYTAVGFGSWNALLLGAGWVLGERWAEVGESFQAAGPIAIALVALAGAVGLARRLARRRSEARAAV